MKIRLTVRVKPNSQQSRILQFNEKQQTLEVALHAPPRDGEANAALIKLLCRTLKLPARHVQLLRGHKSRNKLVEIECTPDALSAFK